LCRNCEPNDARRDRQGLPAYSVHFDFYTVLSIGYSWVSAAISRPVEPCRHIQAGWTESISSMGFRRVMHRLCTACPQPVHSLFTGLSTGLSTASRYSAALRLLLPPRTARCIRALRRKRCPVPLRPWISHTRTQSGMRRTRKLLAHRLKIQTALDAYSRRLQSCEHVRPFLPASTDREPR
jgi:hypothetical protein